MAMSRHLIVGETGEKIACDYLRKQGIRIVDTRVRLGRLEIDIIGRLKRDWIFVEVKTRTGTTFGPAAEGLDPRKRRRFRRAVEIYLDQNRLTDQPVRCDFVAVDIEADGTARVEHFPAIEW